MHTKLSSTLPAWRIVRPDPADELLDAYRDAEAEFGIPWRYLAAINLVETGIGRIRGTSIAGAQGPMQFLPATWEAYGGGGDINDTHDAIRGAARYLAANNGANDIANALYRYNHSNRYVARRADLRRPDRRAPAGVPRLLPLGRLVPHRPGRGVPARSATSRPSRSRSPTTGR